MDGDLFLRQLDFVFHVYCAMLAFIKVVAVMLVSDADASRSLIFVFSGLQLAFHGLALRQM